MVIAAVTKPNPPMDYAADARNMVSNGKPRMAPTDPLAADHYQTLPPGITIKYTYEANRLCRVIHPSHSVVHHSHELALSHILLEPSAGHSVARGRPLYPRHGGPHWPYGSQRPNTESEASVW